MGQSGGRMGVPGSFSTGSKSKQVKGTGLLTLPPPRPTTDGNADRFKAFQAFRALIFSGVVKPPICLPSGLYSAGFACRSGKEKALPPALQRFWKEWNHV